MDCLVSAESDGVQVRETVFIWDALAELLGGLLFFLHFFICIGSGSVELKHSNEGNIVIQLERAHLLIIQLNEAALGLLLHLFSHPLVHIRHRHPQHIASLLRVPLVNSLRIELGDQILAQFRVVLVEEGEWIDVWLKGAEDAHEVFFLIHILDHTVESHKPTMQLGEVLQGFTRVQAWDVLNDKEIMYTSRLGSLLPVICKRNSTNCGICKSVMLT